MNYVESELFRFIHNSEWEAAEILLLEESNSTLTSNSTLPLTKQNVLHRACTNNAPAHIVKGLIERGAHISAVDKNGDTPLILACKNKRSSLEIIQTLIDKGADVNASRNLKNNRLTPLISAVKNNSNPDLVILLLKAGANVNTVFDGKSVLDWARITQTPVLPLLQMIPTMTLLCQSWMINEERCYISKLPLELLKRLKSYLY